MAVQAEKPELPLRQVAKSCGRSYGGFQECSNVS